MASPTAFPRSRLALRRLELPAGLLLALGLVLLLAAALEWHYADRIWPGVYIGEVAVGGLTETEARARWSATLPDPQQPLWIVQVPGFRREISMADLGARVDEAGTLQDAMAIGRGAGFADWPERIQVWWSGRSVPPRIIIDKDRLDAQIAAWAAAIDRPPRDATLSLQGGRVLPIPAETGRRLDRAAARERLLTALATLRPAVLDLPMEILPPALEDVEPARTQLAQWLQAPIHLVLPTRTLPVSPSVTGPWILSPQDLAGMVTVVRVEGPRPHLEAQIDENRLRAWLAPLAETLRADPVDARFVFDEAEGRLIPIAPARFGYRMVLTDTLVRIRESLSTLTREVPVAIELLPPRYPETVTAEALGITGRIAQATTIFKGSSPARVRNITLGAARMHGLLIPPGEVFSFNAHLGDVSLDAGFEEAPIIYNGRTIRGVGGGICQVSTTLFRAAFFGGFPIVERWPHAYRVGWYERTFGPGLDAAIFTPTADFKFRNDREGPVLITAHVDPQAGTLTFTLYGPDDGRKVIIEGPFVTNVVPHGPDIYEKDPTLPKGKVVQMEWAVDGADVRVHRRVERGGTVLWEDTVFTRYQPWPAVFKVGTGGP